MKKDYEYTLYLEQIYCVKPTGEVGNDEVYLEIRVNGEFYDYFFRDDTLDMTHASDENTRYVDISITLKFRDEVEIILWEQGDHDDQSDDDKIGSDTITRTDADTSNEGKSIFDDDGEYEITWRIIDKPIPVSAGRALMRRISS